MADLSGFLSGGGILRRELFTASGTWTKPDDIIGDQVWVTLIGGGSSGNASSSAGTRLGGASGQYFVRESIDVSGSSSVSVTVGSGGAAVNSAVDADGNAGASSSFGAFITASGGVVAGSGGEYLGGSLNGGNRGAVNFGNYPVRAISGIFGAPTNNYRVSGTLGGSGLLLGTSLVQAGEGDSGYAGFGYGSGGSASTLNVDSGAGADGAVMIEYLEKA